MTGKLESTPAIGISYQVGVSETKQVVFQCFVPMDCDPAELNGALDKLRVAADRQEAHARLPKARERLAAFVKAHKRAIEDMFRLDAEREEAHKQIAQQSGDRRNPRLNAQQLAHEQKTAADRANAEVSMKRAEGEIAELQAEIADLEQKVA